MSEERKQKILERKKALYACNKELSEIDPNLIIKIKLKRSDYFALITFGTCFSYFVVFKNTNKAKKFFGLLAFWLVAQWNIAVYYRQIYPFVLLKNTKQLLEKEKTVEKQKTL